MNFMFCIEDIFKIAGRGTVITGLISNGSISVGDTLFTENKDTLIVKGIEKNRKLIDNASDGDYVGILTDGQPNIFTKGLNVVKDIDDLNYFNKLKEDNEPIELSSAFNIETTKDIPAPKKEFIFCMNCGEKLPSNASFCFGCGEKITNSIPQDSQQDSTTANVPSPEKSVEEKFTILGEEILINHKIKDYVSIRTLYYSKAVKAVQLMKSNYYTKYSTLQVFLDYADTAMEDIFNNACQAGLELLQQNDIYVYNLIKVREKANEYMDEWHVFKQVLVEMVTEIRNDEIDELNYRQARKNGRGRVFGGGFGVGGAVKGMLTAGAINATAGAFHSLGNAVGNASTSANARKLETELYQDEEFILSLVNAVMVDVLNIHLAIIDLFNEAKGTSIPKPYNEAAYEEAAIMMENVKSNVVNNSTRNKIIIEAIKKWPFELDFYKYILDHHFDEKEEITKYSTFFKTDISHLIEERMKELNHHDNLLKIYGENTTDFQEKLKSNDYYNLLQYKIGSDYLENIMLAYNLNRFNLPSNQLYFLADNPSEKARKCAVTARLTYAKYDTKTEKAFIVFDNTAFGNGKEGFIITDKTFYQKTRKEIIKIPIRDIKSVELIGKELKINDQTIAMYYASAKDLNAIFQFISFILYCIVYSPKNAILSPEELQLASHNPKQITEKEEISVSDETKTITDLSTVDEAPDEIAQRMQPNEIENYISSFVNANINYYFYSSNSTKGMKRTKKAIASYAKLEDGEKPYAIFDNTVFGGAKEGFLITDHNLYYHNSLSKAVKLPIKNITTMNISKGSLYINQENEVNLTMLLKENYQLFLEHIEEILNALR